MISQKILITDQERQQHCLVGWSILLYHWGLLSPFVSHVFFPPETKIYLWLCAYDFDLTLVSTCYWPTLVICVYPLSSSSYEHPRHPAQCLTSRPSISTRWLMLGLGFFHTHGLSTEPWDSLLAAMPQAPGLSSTCKHQQPQDVATFSLPLPSSEIR